MRWTNKRSNRIKSRASIERLFTRDSQNAIASGFLFLRYSQGGDAAIKVAVIVPKRHFKRAVHRNLLKRRMRAALTEQLNTPEFEKLRIGSGIEAMFIYRSSKIHAFSEINVTSKRLLTKLLSSFETNKT